MKKTRIFCPFFSWNLLRKMLPTASTRTRRREKMEARPTTGEREKSEDNGNGLLWRIVTDHQDIFDTHIVTKLNGNDVKFFYDVNNESRTAIQRAVVHLPDAFKIGDFDTTSTISWALETCSEKKERFCHKMAEKGNVELLQFLHENGCPWGESTCYVAAKNGHLECLRYAHENECPWDEDTCLIAALNGHLECLKYAHESGCPGSLEYAREYLDSDSDSCDSSSSTSSF
jgi:hypothetical protein